MKVFKVIVNVLAILPIATQHSGPWRAGPMRMRDEKNENSDVTPIISNHLKLARVFNALYLQMQLSEGKIKENDVIAGIWNMKDRTALEKLVGLDVSGLQRELKDVDIQLEKIQNVPNQIVDVNGLQADLGSLQEIPDDALNKIRTAAMQKYDPPKLKYLFSMETITDDSVRLNLDLLENAEKGTEPSILQCNEFTSRIESIPLTDAYYKEIDSLVNTRANRASVKSLLNGMAPMRNIYRKAADLDNFLQKIKVAQSKLQILKPLVAVLPKPEAINNVKGVRTLIEDCLVRPTDIPIGSAFIPNHDVSKVYEDLKSDWLKSIFGEIGNLTMFSTVLDDFRTFTNGYKAVDNSLRDILAENGREEIFKRIPNFVDSINTMNNVSTYLSSKNQFCVNFHSQSEPKEASEIRDIVSRLYDAIWAFDDVRDFLNRSRAWDPFDDQFAVAEKLGQDCKKISNLSEWVNSQEFKDTKVFLQSINPYIEVFVVEKRHYDTLRDLTTISSKIDKIQKWMKASKLADNTCEWPRTLNLDPLRDLDKKVAVIDQVKKSNTLKTTDALFKSISSLKAQVQALSLKSNMSSNNGTSKSTPSPKGKPAPRTKRDAKGSSLNIDRQKLLDFSFAVYSFSQMEKLRSMDKDFDVIYKEEQQTLAAIKTIKNAETLQKVEGVWKNYPDFKKDLETLRIQNKRSLGRVKSEKEKDLRDVGKVYKNLATVLFPEKVDIGKYKDTLKLMGLQKSSNIGIALNNLSYPVSMNWNLVHANFRKIPFYFDEIMRDLEELSGPKKIEEHYDPPRESNWEPWFTYALIAEFSVMFLISVVLVVTGQCGERNKEKIG